MRLGARLRRRGKHAAELAYWRARRTEAELERGVPYYEWAFTEHFGLGRDFFRGKRMLDVGCGPRGSLEWADDAAERVGVDPLADRYRELHSQPHSMTYVTGGAESIPFAAGSFDVISSFNALDHVDDVDAAVAEMTRVAAADATLLLLVDIEHEPTATEPHRLPWTVLEAFDGWEVAEERHFERPHDNLLANLIAAKPFDHGDPSERPGVLSARLLRR